MFFNHCRLKTVRLIQFEIKHFEPVARCLTCNQWKNTRKISEIIVYLHSQVQRVFFLTSAYDQSYFSNCNNRRISFAHAGILLSFMQHIDEYLVALKDFDYSCSLGFKCPITPKSKWRHVDEMNIAKGL